MTISDERKRVITFTVPFMSVGLSVVYLKPKEGEEPPFKHIKDLPEQNNIKYGLVRDGMTHNFFKNSRNVTFQKMWRKISSPGDGLMNTNLDGIDKVRSSAGAYAFIMESTTAEYYINKKPCDLASISIEKKGSEYGLAVPTSSRHISVINEGLRKLKKDGTIEKLKKKWWKGDCQPYDDSNGVANLKMMTSSVFAFLLISFFNTL